MVECFSFATNAAVPDITPIGVSLGCAFLILSPSNVTIVPKSIANPFCDSNNSAISALSCLS